MILITNLKLIKLNLKKQAKFCLIIVLLIISNSAIAQNLDSTIRLKLDTIKGLSESVIPTQFLYVSKIWPENGTKADSILWQVSMQYDYGFTKRLNSGKMSAEQGSKMITQYKIDTSGLKCNDLPIALYVLV